ncbi:hypothetical protein [Geomicrobium sp. JCM 19038]|uniref:AtuA-related protein n=1 Tax=Geomicrobium sp. JCM 19038 TaxID=1460635 RepID=UPI00045F49D0|nr:hypothetical protein [Geomicrobium sp. JCM 19038]GAK09485.1 hypothetical protein JCM19038_3324 [Geomicrobium sp. JCM 19038]
MIPLYKLAHARAGDKGEHTTISIFAYDDQDYPILVEQLTTQAVSTFFADLHVQDVERYTLPNLSCVHFVLYGTRPGGVSSALTFDAHGKSLSWRMLDFELKN